MYFVADMAVVIFLTRNRGPNWLVHQCGFFRAWGEGDIYALLVLVERNDCYVQSAICVCDFGFFKLGAVVLDVALQLPLYRISG